MSTGPTGEQTGWLERYRGLSVEQALRLARIEGRSVRVTGPGRAVTADWSPERLTIRVDADGALVEVRAG